MQVALNPRYLISIFSSENRNQSPYLASYYSRFRASRHLFSYGGTPELSRILAIFSASQLRHQLIAEAVFDLKPHAAEHLHSGNEEQQHLIGYVL